MTDKVHSLTLVLDGDIREDDLEPLIQALRQFRLVVEVETNVADAASFTYQCRADVQMNQFFVAMLGAIVKGGVREATKALSAVERSSVP